MMPEVNVEPQKTPQENSAESLASTGEQGAVRRMTTPPEGFRRCAMRLIRDAHGMVLVYELEPSVKDSAPSTLVFESPGRAARLEQYPAGWKTLPNDQLLALRDVH